MDKQEFKAAFLEMMHNRENPFHPFVWINGEPEFGENVYIGGFSEVNAKGARVYIGDNCDIASFVAINVADSHMRVLGLAEQKACQDIIIEHNVFIGSHCVILGGVYIGHHSVIGAGSVVRNCKIPPYSLAVGNPLMIKQGYYREKYELGKSSKGDDSA